MPNTAPVGDTVTVLMTVDSTARIGLFSGGTKISEQQVGNATQTFPLIVSALRFGATEPGGYNPGALLMEKISAWTAPLTEADALLVSANLAYTPPISTGPLPVLSLPTALSVREGLVLQIPVTKTGTGACSATIRTIGDSATTPLHYTGFSQTITFGASVALINIPLTTVTTAAADSGKKLKVVLEAPSGCTLGNATTVVTITELPRISVPTLASVKEGEVLNLIVSKTGTGACSVTWRTAAITASVALSDYLGQNATVLSFAENEMQKTVSVTTLTDLVVEPPETFNVFLENAIGCTITTGSCEATILDANSPEVPVQTALTPANGYATSSTFGLGYPVVKVTNLNDSGAGSLREALSGGNRVIVFEVGGRITLASDLLFYQNNVTVAGETAPAPGITIQKFAGLVNGNHVDIRHLTFEKGYIKSPESGNSDTFRIATGSAATGAPRIVTTHVRISHCAFYWAMDGTLDMNPVGTREPKNVSIHDCIFAEPLRWPNTFDPAYSNHPKVYPSLNANQTQHNYGVLFAAGVRTVDMQYCLFSDCDMREPFIDHSTEVVLANTLANNCNRGVQVQHNPNPTVYKITCKGYLVISGPDTSTSAYSGFRFNYYELPQPANSAVYVTGLYAMKGGTAVDNYKEPGTTVTYGITATGFDGVPGKPYWLNGTTKVAVEVSTPPIDTPVPTVALGSGQEIFDRAVLNVGPRPKEIRELIAGAMTIGNKDVARTIRQLKAKTGRWPNHEDETYIGGFYAPAQVTRTLNSTAKFRDGTLIGVPPTGLATPTAASRAEMAAWLRRHLDQVQND